MAPGDRRALLALIATRPPLEHLVVVPTTGLYGWWVARRFGNDPGSCVLGCGVERPSGALLAVCPLIRNRASRIACRRPMSHGQLGGSVPLDWRFRSPGPGESNQFCRMSHGAAASTISLCLARYEAASPRCKIVCEMLRQMQLAGFRPSPHHCGLSRLPLSSTLRVNERTKHGGRGCGKLARRM